jgi:hypothetical protein
VVQEVTRCKHPQAETLGGTKVAKVVRDEELRPARYRDLDDHVVIWILQERAPKEEDFLPNGNPANPIDEVLDVLSTLATSKVTKQRRLILGDERDRDGDLEKIALDGVNDLERRSQPGAPCRDEHRGIENDPHRRMVS